MEYFLETSGSIVDGVGFALFDGLHLGWLGAFLVITVASCVYYRGLSNDKRRIWRYVIAALMLADELFKHLCLIAGGNWAPEYLPLHLCSINIF